MFFRGTEATMIHARRRKPSRGCLSGLCLVFLLFASLGCGQQQPAPVIDTSTEGGANLVIPQSSFNKVEATKGSGGPIKKGGAFLKTGP
jgi:hypothetical protein